MAGYVAVGQAEITRLAAALRLAPSEFVRKHTWQNNRGERLIKAVSDPCQFLGKNRRCTVYEARPNQCRAYFCWEKDATTYRIASILQSPAAE
jgi:Fe-S-cluster containining protein